MASRFPLDGKVALVTGGAGILGSEFCRGLLQRGAQVVLADIDGAAADLGGQTDGHPRVRGGPSSTSSVYGVVSSDNRIYEGSSYLGRQINNPAVY